ncbi:MAG TPA: hypothetical protein VI643_08175, partial [Planctomycetota bacterium]|nr:hypothetical protein [Planctomycetota bacterium]
MRMNARWFFAALALPAVLPAASAEPPQDPQEERFYFDEVSESVLKVLDTRVQEKDWKELCQAYRGYLQANLTKLCRLPEDTSKFVSFTEYFIRLFSKLPMEAVDEYRRQFDSGLASAVHAFEISGDSARLESACESFFFARRADVQIDRLANRAFESGHWGPAARNWRRLLKYYPDPTVDIKAVAAKLIVCAQLLRSQPLLDETKALIGERKIQGAVYIGAEKVAFGEFADKATVAAGWRAPKESKPALPELALRSENRSAWGGHPSIEMKRGRFDNSWAQSSARITPHSIPAYGSAAGREFLVYNDGVRLLVLDPRRLDLGRESSARYWEATIESKDYTPK